MPPYVGPEALAGATEAGNRFAGQQAVSNSPTADKAPAAPRLRISDFRRVTKNTLRGFCVIELPNGLRIHDVAVHQRDGAEWVSFPAVPQLEGGAHRIVDGKPQYKRVIEWANRTLSDGFSAAVCTELRRQYPDAFDNRRAP